MGEEKPPEFYDGVKYDKPHIYDRYKVIYEAAAGMLPSVHQSPRIVDLGCGVGHFAKLVKQKAYESYLGIDFSPEMIRRSKMKVQDKGFEFVQGNLLDSETQVLYNGDNLFVLLEVLEHITEDFNVFKSIPSGSQVIFSMPSFDARSHVRRFKHADLVIRRYEKYLKFNTTETIQWKPRAYVFLFNCERR
jgi:2-polyprenyl-3-methyl-5-hydroxy-6-metoxy-1,4-benzoquinol methylase